MPAERGNIRMVEVKTLYEAVFSNIAGNIGESIGLSKPTLGGLLETLTRKYGKKFGDWVLDPQTGDFVNGVCVLINGRRSPLDAALTDGDEVSFIMALAGG